MILAISRDLKVEKFMKLLSKEYVLRKGTKCMLYLLYYEYIP